MHVAKRSARRSPSHRVISQADREQAGRGQVRPRTYRVRCKNGEEKAILFRPVELCDNTQYVT
jgi:hypothetical protein